MEFIHLFSLNQNDNILFLPVFIRFSGVFGISSSFEYASAWSWKKFNYFFQNACFPVKLCGKTYSKNHLTLFETICILIKHFNCWGCKFTNEIFMFRLDSRKKQIPKAFETLQIKSYMLIYDKITAIAWNSTQVAHSSGMSTPQSE